MGTTSFENCFGCSSPITQGFDPIFCFDGSFFDKAPSEADMTVIITQILLEFPQKRAQNSRTNGLHFAFALNHIACWDEGSKWREMASAGVEVNSPPPMC